MRLIDSLEPEPEDYEMAFAMIEADVALDRDAIH
jgi:hypothetical protein